MAELHFGSETFELADGEDPTRLAESIEERVRNRGGWVDVTTAQGRLSLFVTPGVTIWLNTSVVG
jgi:hypothetical protein